MVMMFPTLITKAQSNYSLKYFSELNSSFNEAPASITKKYKLRKTQANLTTIQKDVIEESYLSIIDPKTKDKYMKYLAWNFVFSQPNSIDSFKKNFCSYVSPNYIFSLTGDKPNIPRYVKLNFLKLEISIFDKGDPLVFLDIDEIEIVKKEENSIKIGLYKNKKQKILLTPSIPTQNELIYILIMYMAYWKETQGDQMNQSNQLTTTTSQPQNNTTTTTTTNNNMKEKEKEKKISIIDTLVRTDEEINIKELIMIQNDYYVPSGIVLRAKVFIEKKKKNSDYDRYIVLGNAMIGIFKDDSMIKLLQVIPLAPLYVFFTFNYETNLMKIGIPNQDLLIYFDSLDEMQIWQEMLYSIAEGKVEERISDETLTGLYANYQVNGSDNKSYATSTITRLETQIKELENQLHILRTKKKEMAKYISKENDDKNK